MANDPYDRKLDDGFDTPLNEDKEQFCSMKAEKPVPKNNGTVLVIIIVAFIIALGFIASSPAAICLLFFMIGVLMIVLPIVRKRALLKVCTEVVSATCIYLDEQESTDSDGDSTTLYAPTWEFRSGEKVYRISETSYSNMDVPKVGQIYELLVNPVNPNQIYRDQPFFTILLLIMGIIFIAASVVAGVAVMVSL